MRKLPELVIHVTQHQEYYIARLHTGYTLNAQAEQSSPKEVTMTPSKLDFLTSFLRLCHDWMCTKVFGGDGKIPLCSFS